MMKKLYYQQPQTSLLPVEVCEVLCQSQEVYQSTLESWEEEDLSN